MTMTLCVTDANVREALGILDLFGIFWVISRLVIEVFFVSPAAENRNFDNCNGDHNSANGASKFHNNIKGCHLRLSVTSKSYTSGSYTKIILTKFENSPSSGFKDMPKEHTQVKKNLGQDAVF